MENLKKICNYYKLPIGKLTYTDDNIIQMKTPNNEEIIGFSSILNHFHEKIEKNKNSENYFFEKQYFDYANIYLRSTSKKDKRKLSLEIIKLFH